MSASTVSLMPEHNGPLEALGIKRIGLIHFLDGCRKKQLKQVPFVLCPMLVFHRVFHNFSLLANTASTCDELKDKVYNY